VIRLLVVDDSSLLRILVSRMLDNIDGIEVVGECADGSDVVVKAAAVTPDVVLMDVSMPVMNGPEAARLLQQWQPAVRVLMYSSTGAAQERKDSADAAAAGFLVKDGDFGKLVAAIRTIAAGGLVWPEPGVQA
jgi:DNA-binding NarL/FixJ family response regulator